MRRKEYKIIMSLWSLITLLCLSTIPVTTSKHLRHLETPAPLPDKLPLRQDIYTLIKSAKSKAKEDLIILASSRPDNEHRVDEWAKSGMDAIKTTIESQMQSHKNLHAHMRGWLEALLEECLQLKVELDEKLHKAMQPPSIELHHKNKDIAPGATDSRTPYEKVVDNAHNELKVAVESAQQVTREADGNVVDNENKYDQPRRQKYHKLGKLVYALEKSMSELQPSLDSSKAVLHDKPTRTLTSEHKGLRDSVEHVEHMMKRANVALKSVKSMSSSYPSKKAK
jgi:hypothetical protein